MPDLLVVTDTVYIVCHSENVDHLLSALTMEGFSVKVNRQVLDRGHSDYSLIIRCLINHYSVWKKIAKSNNAAIVVEADFVPVKGFGRLPCPYPASQRERSFGYLYGCGIELYDIVNSGFARGHSASTVACLISPLAAHYLCEFAENIIETNDLTEYSPWDTRMRYYIQTKGINSFISFRNCGEHGGFANREHRRVAPREYYRHLRIHNHRADVLAAPLHFLPAYAKDSHVVFWFVRTLYFMWGVGRLIAGKTLRMRDIKRQDRPVLILNQVRSL